MPDIQIVVAFLEILRFLFKPFYKGYKWFVAPRVIWGYLDTPNPEETHYYIFAKSNRSENFNQSIKIILEPKFHQLSDYKIEIVEYYQFYERMHRQKIDIVEVDLQKQKEISFDMPFNVLYRIVVKSSCHSKGILAHFRCVLHLKADGAVVEYKCHKPPFHKHIKIIRFTN